MLKSKKSSVKNSWELVKSNGDKVIKHYDSEVITFKKNGDIILYNANYSKTTMRLVNSHLPKGIYINQKNYSHYVTIGSKVLPYTQNMVIKAKLIKQVQ